MGEKSGTVRKIHILIDGGELFARFLRQVSLGEKKASFRPAKRNCSPSEKKQWNIRFKKKVRDQNRTVDDSAK
eukprot:930297-Prorocentrum_minimum.AAC.1